MWFALGVLVCLTVACLLRAVPSLWWRVWYHLLRCRVWLRFTLSDVTQPVPVGHSRGAYEVRSLTLGEPLSGGYIGAVTRASLSLRRSRETGPDDAHVRVQSGGSGDTLVVVKRAHSNASGLFSSALAGSGIREARWLRYLSQQPELRRTLANAGKGFRVPGLWWASYTPGTGWYEIVQDWAGGEATSSVNPLLGNQCWGGVPDPRPAHWPSQHDIMLRVAAASASLHATFWGRAPQVAAELPWLKYVNWMQGRDRETWEIAKASIAGRWAELHAPGATMANGEPPSVRWSPRIMRAMQLGLDAWSWSTWRSRYSLRAPGLTLVHGDYHAGNMLMQVSPGSGGHGDIWSEDDLDAARIALVDWSEVGVFEACGELAQFVVSNCTIELRRAHEQEWVRHYWETMVQLGVPTSELSWSQCWDTYKRVGVQHWLQMLVIMASFGHRMPNMLPVASIQWFHDQVAAFLEDHWEDGDTPFFGYMFTISK